MTKFEIARVIGARAQQIAMGAPPTITINSVAGALDPLVIAREELKEFAIPMIIRRPLPDGTYEDWPISKFDTRKQQE
ncbi:DNA-directed_RNA polymerase II RPB6 [Hexamita inflata]|uniref:DNA-directed RNA polymerase II RPB6 n=1 Tax=Hexamita inflata TaxID=28002 RepID=A0AA86P9S3_9EUKA|nr:DNA-directed RNA polymerase II RPB6 [Hexamita inflata]CAI9934702.1 DNA-directed RNA polymerase II RPB6 [Hexamita inflata]CAI9939092.1 DNA-directed RNA polymerase II RPB6 [Hexamita inflata]